MLLARKVDVNARENKFQQTALMWATGKPAVVRLLLDHGADVKAASRSWDTKTTNYTVVLSLMSSGSDWSVDNEYHGPAGGITALIFAAQKGDLESVKMLLDAGADVNQVSADGTTSLLASLYHFVPEMRNVRRTQRGVFDGLSFSANYKVANLLLDRGAKVNVADRAGYTPLHGAVLSLLTFNSGGLIVTGYDTTIGDAGRARAPNAPGPVLPADMNGGLALVARLLAMGADPNAATKGTSPGPLGAVKVNPATIGSTPYHLAAVSNNAQLVAMLADKGADPNKLRYDGHTPFSVAVLSDFPAAVQTMADHGAIMTTIYAPAEKIEAPGLDRAQLRKGQTITHIAAEALAYRVIALLAAHGAPLEAKNTLGETPLDIAESMERTRYASTTRALGNSDLKIDKVWRETKTSDALKTLIAKKSIFAVN
jgi:ankyrin repeat protein